jgi:hypothetical protein
VARCRNGRAARPGADGCANAPRDSLGILTDAIRSSERDSDAIGQQNALTASNSGLLRLGFITAFLSRPVMEGFVFGLAIFVTVSQLPKLFGLKKGPGDTIRQLVYLIAHLGDTSLTTLAVGAVALVLLFALERYLPRLPGGLVVLVARHRHQRRAGAVQPWGGRGRQDPHRAARRVGAASEGRRLVGAATQRGRDDAGDLQ